MIAEPNITRQYEAQVDFNVKSKDSPRILQMFSVSLIFRTKKRNARFFFLSTISLWFDSQLWHEQNIYSWMCRSIIISMKWNLCRFHFVLYQFTCLQMNNNCTMNLLHTQNKCLMEYLRKKIPFIWQFVVELKELVQRRKKKHFIKWKRLLVCANYSREWMISQV